MQVVAALTVGGLGWSAGTHGTPDVPPVEERLLALDVPEAQARVEAAIEAATSPGALLPEDERSVRSFASLAGAGAGLVVTEATFKVRPSQGAIRPVDLVVSFEGDVYDVPVYLDLLHRQAAVGGVVEVSLEVQPGGACSGFIRRAFYRPDAGDTSWIGERLATAAPGADYALPVLQRAAVLAAWRSFDAALPGMAEQGHAWRDRAMAELSPQLVRLRHKGGQVSWTPEGGVKIR